MAKSKEEQDDAVLLVNSMMRGILALLVDARERATIDDKGIMKTEVLLSQAGMSIEGISQVTGKKYDAVRMAIKRGGAK